MQQRCSHDPAQHYEHTPEVERVEVTRVRFHRGAGCCEESPVRVVTAWYDETGKFAEFDPAPRSAVVPLPGPPPPPDE